MQYLNKVINTLKMTAALAIPLAFSMPKANAEIINEQTANNVLTERFQQYSDQDKIQWFGINYPVDLNGKIFTVNVLYLQDGIYKIEKYFTDDASIIKELEDYAKQLGIPITAIPPASSIDDIKNDSDANVISGLPQTNINYKNGFGEVEVGCEPIDDADGYYFSCGPYGTDTRSTEKNSQENSYKFKINPGKYLISSRISKDGVKGPISAMPIENWIGDLNKDGNFDISDVILCLRQAIELDPRIPDSDVNFDETTDISDVILILRKAIGLD